jgi:hypothetical protein
VCLITLLLPLPRSTYFLTNISFFVGNQKTSAKFVYKVEVKMSFTRTRAESDTVLRPDPSTSSHLAPRKNGTKAAETKERHEKKTASSSKQMVDKGRIGIYRWKISLGLFGPFALQALDTTIIASALPYIATDFGKA